MVTGLVAAIMLCLPLAFATPAAASASTASAALLFSIAKSENKNQVEYAVHVDDQCVPVPGAPVFAYWRMLEVGPNRVAPLLSRELRAYGIARQKVGDHGNVHLVLRALPNRPILVQTGRAADGKCHASSKTSIGGAPAYLFNVYLKLKWPFGVEYMLLRGWSMDRTRVVTERLEP